MQEVRGSSRQGVGRLPEYSGSMRSAGQDDEGGGTRAGEDVRSRRRRGTYVLASLGPSSLASACARTTVRAHTSGWQRPHGDVLTALRSGCGGPGQPDSRVADGAKQSTAETEDEAIAQGETGRELRGGALDRREHAGESATREGGGRPGTQGERAPHIDCGCVMIVLLALLVLRHGPLWRAPHRRFASISARRRRRHRSLLLALVLAEYGTASCTPHRCAPDCRSVHTHCSNFLVGLPFPAGLHRLRRPAPSHVLSKTARLQYISFTHSMPRARVSPRPVEIRYDRGHDSQNTRYLLPGAEMLAEQFSDLWRETGDRADSSSRVTGAP